LSFIVVGAGIGGLATAAALCRAGHDVLVLEQSTGTIKSKGGMQSPPNMTRLLLKWGLAPALARCSHKCDRLIFTNGATGALIGFLHMGEEFMRDLGAEFLFLQHQDLHDMLRNLAVNSGAKLRFTARVIGMDTSKGSVTLENSEVLKADIVVIADGFDSELRKAVTEDENVLPDAMDAHVVATFQVPMAAIRADPALTALCAPHCWNIWRGNEYMMNANILVGEDSLSVTIIHDFAGPRAPHNANWAEGHSLADLGIDLKNFAPIPGKVLALAATTTVTSHIFIRRPVAVNFVSATSRTLLLGEAAHPMLPASNHGIALVLEDADTLGELFSQCVAPSHPAQLLTAYDDLRQERAALIHFRDAAQCTFSMCISQNPSTCQCDAVLRFALSNGEWDRTDDSHTFHAVLGKELELWANDAGEQVAGWWRMYG
ncbi:hypothetical protein HYPSUDRAFT_116595, partial [Hypholoma sublateritium FD-334 SS-4]